MRRYRLLGVDVALVIVATVLAVTVRDNLSLSLSRLAELSPYFATSVIAALVAFPLLGLDRSIWRFSSSSDYWRLLTGMAIVSSAALLSTFTLNRMDGVARAMPILQFIIGSGLMVAAREMYRVRRAARDARRVPVEPLQTVQNVPLDTTLVVGLSRLTELYLQSVAELGGGHVRVAGVLGRSDRHVGRMFASYPILGLPEDVERVLVDLQAHGEIVSRIVVTAGPDSLSEAAHEALLRVERSSGIQLQFLADDLGFVRESRIAEDAPAEPKRLDLSQGFNISPEALEAIARRPYWKVKRFLDVVSAGVLLILLVPAFALVALLVGSTIGSPIVFWQQRPGLYGWPFRLLKFRTMGPAQSRSGRKLSDEERTSSAGNLLRRLRMDELPQLINILRGEMSFVGPRPLLPRDQSDTHRARLLVRPGLTGWAQIVGGRAISAEDKAALDVWYVHNASFLLDLRIVLSTIPIVIFGERTSHELIGRAWRDLLAAGVIGGDLAIAVRQRLDSGVPSLVAPPVSS